jgi:chemotaxis methyl-accepting protein methylase
MTAVQDDEFDALLARVERERGFACAGYKRRCLRRRVGARMRARGLDVIADYSALLDRESREMDRLVDALTINVTRFFRNWPVWERIAESVVAPLWASQLPDIRVWSAGGAAGQEALSAAILFHWHAATAGMLAQIGRVHVLATDVDRSALAAAEAPGYDEGDLGEVPLELRQRYFPGHAPFEPGPGIRDMTRFVQHDLLGDDYPPAAQHVIICRNVLIYFDRPTQERVLTRFHESLAPGGYLILGKVESLLGPSRSRFVPVAQRERIFRKVS